MFESCHLSCGLSRGYRMIGITKKKFITSSDPFVRNFFVRTEPLAESNPDPQDPISAIHLPCLYAGDVASAMGFGLCSYKIINGIVALHSSSMRKVAAEKKGTMFRSARCTGALVDTGRENVKCVVHNEQKETTTSALCWSADANTV
ncbi:hypothetical protein RYX36_026071, partial [Vicia faba]